MAPRAKNTTSIAYPLFRDDGLAEGWYRFTDEYLRPEVLYGSLPSVTSLKLGGRVMEVDRPVPLKIKLLEEREDAHFWCMKKQHEERINLGEYHRDFGDVEVAYSFSAPQTHVWFAGYSIHFEAFENLTFTSYNATVRVRPEHILGNNFQIVGRQEFEAGLRGDFDVQTGGARPMQQQVGVHGQVFSPQPFSTPETDISNGGSPQPQTAASQRNKSVAHLSTSPLASRSAAPLVNEAPAPGNAPQRELMIKQYLEQQTGKRSGYFPLYATHLPYVDEGLPGRKMLNYAPTGLHLNDCERDIHLRDEYNVGCNIAKRSSPVSVPPVFRPIEPYEIPETIFTADNACAKGGLHVSEVLFHRRTGEQNRKIAERRLPHLMNIHKPNCVERLVDKNFEPCLLDKNDEAEAEKNRTHQHLLSTSGSRRRRNKYIPSRIGLDGSFIPASQYARDTSYRKHRSREANRAAAARQADPTAINIVYARRAGAQLPLPKQKELGYLPEPSPGPKTAAVPRYGSKLVLDPFNPNRIPDNIAVSQDIATKNLVRLTPSSVSGAHLRRYETGINRFSLANNSAAGGSAILSPATMQHGARPAPIYAS